MIQELKTYWKKWKIRNKPLLATLFTKGVALLGEGSERLSVEFNSDTSAPAPR